MDGPSLAREYYRSIDEDDYDALADILAPEFVQHRPDGTLSGRDRFVRFMREERPETDTEHVLEAVYVATGGDGCVPEGDRVTTEGDRVTTEGDRVTTEGDRVTTEGDRVTTEGDRVAAEGRLLRADGSVWFEFVDTFEVADGRLESLRTYTNGG